jgi:uncharacterized membrane protein
MQHAIHVKSVPLPEIRVVHSDQPLRWLADGWRDMHRSPDFSIGYGIVVALTFAVLTIVMLQTAWYDSVMSLAAGFVFIGPILAVGLYEISRRAENKESLTLTGVLGSWRRNGGQLMAMGVMLMLILLGWMRLSLLLFAVLFDTVAVGWGPFVSALFTTAEGGLFLLAFFGTGLVTAAIVFALTVVAVPLLLDRPETDAISAMLISYEAVRQNLAPMILWAVIIGIVTTAGMLTFYLGMAVVFPLLGHASWHAYRDIIGR